MGKKLNLMSDLMVGLAGFMIGAATVSFLATGQDEDNLVPEKVEWLFDRSNALSCQSCTGNFDRLFDPEMQK
ncbi:hypothetical protein K1718_15070 [Roseibium porphyridii]|uniref:Uncharacterized protein n=1 Tax=Roseibium porphyridii TaxID=2866279 RepID=A0ABY8EZT8_9HYPH|nr:MULTISPECIES: hypothetical protein [Stappiaceae]QFT32109.1 hypothetical protein FIV00_16585 [Labrenzia sp. THAF82]WFE87489.1 hypothetical protein K1718_15070 [Roseibium sp. KMA01]